jgi:predicted phosphodiesterase
MPSRNLTVRQRIIDLRNETGLPFSTIAETINEEFNLQGEDKITKDAAQKTYKAHAWMKTLMSKIEDEPEGPAAAIVKKGESVFVQTKGHVPEPEEDAEPEHESPADRFRREFDDRWDSSRADPEPRNPGNYRKVVVCGDWHGNPNKTALQGIIDEDPDVIVLAGDLLNCEQASQHTDDAESLGRLMKDEIGNSRGGIQILSEQTRASILAMHGNHDKWIKRLLKAAGMEWLLSIWPGPLELITRDIPRVEIVNTQTMFHLPDGNAELFAQTQFMLPLGDAVISQLNFTGKHPGAAVLKLSVVDVRMAPPF